jgi:hypothetical protein
MTVLVVDEVQRGREELLLREGIHFREVEGRHPAMPSWMSRWDKPAELAAVAAPDKPSSPR